MILISYPHYTCGGLLCNLINKEFHGFADHGGMDNTAHSLFKEPEDPNDPRLSNLSIEELVQHRLDTYPAETLPLAAGTHFNVLDMPLDMFDKVIHITTERTRSRLYRWTRAYYLQYEQSADWQSVVGLDYIDKARETAKEYVNPRKSIRHSKVVNIEFAEIVDKGPSFSKLIPNYDPYVYDLWRNKNYFLYNNMLHEPAQRMYEAEFELKTNTRYEY